MTNLTKSVFLFGSSEKGKLCVPIRFTSLASLSQVLGHPQEDSMGIEYAVQTLLCERELIFYRVKEEGFAKEDYLRGAEFLQSYGERLRLAAICIPGVGDREIIDALGPISQRLRAILILSERDLYDYLTESKY